MGHIRLGVLPKYPKWRQVIGLLDDEHVPASQVADKVLDGVQAVLAGESAQSCVGYCVWLLAQLTQAARSSDFGGAIAELGIHVTQNTNAMEFLAKTSQVATRQLSDLTPRTAVNNIAGLAFRESLTHTIGIQATTLFGAGLADVGRAFEKYSSSKQFSVLLHVYLTAFLRRILLFVVDKEIAKHVGPGSRFEDIEDLREFGGALEVFASQTSRIVDEFSGGWYSKQVWREGAISESDARRFVHVALGKLRSDLELDEV